MERPRLGMMRMLLVLAAATPMSACEDHAATGLDGGGEDGGSSVPPLGMVADGQPCWADRECASGACAWGCESVGYCARSGCATDADCAVEGDDRTYCCGASGLCQRIAGDRCGAGSGTVGDSCALGLDSDCSDGLYCQGSCFASPYCTRVCTDDAVCRVSEDYYSCLPVAGGDMACIRDPDVMNACAREADCASATESCGLSYAWDGQSVISVCQEPAEDRGAGQSCLYSGSPVDAVCGAGWCWSGTGFHSVCSAVCVDDADCACTGTSCVVDQQTCVPFPFTVGDPPAVSVVRLCYDGGRCTSDGDCPEGRFCGVMDGHVGVELVCMPPVKNPGAWAVGAVCTRHDSCASGYCTADRCTVPKGVGEDCADGAECLTGLCMDSFCTGPCDGDAFCTGLREGTVCRETPVPYGPDSAGTTAPVPLCRPAMM